jgi:cytosolic iron-sulfur assembly component 3
MPCYDKKLEASRQDFYNDVYKTRDVDCVITTGELEHLMNGKGWNLSMGVEEDERPKPYTVADNIRFPELISHPGTSSGSYLHSLMFLVSASHKQQIRDLKLSTRTIRSADYEEFVLEDVATGEIVFKGAKCYGFRNLQNIVRKVGKENGVHGLPGGAVRGRARRKADGQSTQDKGYDYVEVMACPSGCVNGGGQIRPPKKVLEDRTQDAEGYLRQWMDEGVQVADTGLGTGVASDAAAKWGNKDWIRKVESAYWSVTNEDEFQSQSHSAKSSDTGPDAVATRVLMDLCHPVSGSFDRPRDKSDLGAESTVTDDTWMQRMDVKAEVLRSEFFRTNYRKVESEVVGLAVKW